MKKGIFASLIVLLLVVMALSGCTDENIDNVDETNGTVDENGGEDGGDEQPSSVDFQFVRKIEIHDGIYPPIIFANNHFYVSYEMVHNIYVKVYNENFTPTGEEYLLTDHNMGDHQMVFADNYFYLIYMHDVYYADAEAGKPKEDRVKPFYLKKFDSDWNEVKEICVNEHTPMIKDEGVADFLFQYADDSLYLGTEVFNPPEKSEIPVDNNDLYIREFNTNLEFQDEFYLSGIGSAMGLSMIFRDGTFIIVLTKNFEDALGSLTIQRYDKDWNFIDEKRISFPEPGGFSSEHMVRGFIFEDGRYFISYTDPTKKGTEVADMGDITLKAFDSEWNLLGQIKVTKDIPPDKANRAHLALVENKIYVSYDVLEEGIPYSEGSLSKVYVKEYDVIIND